MKHIISALEQRQKNPARFKPNQNKNSAWEVSVGPINLHSTNSEFHVIQAFIDSLNKVPTFVL